MKTSSADARIDYAVLANPKTAHARRDKTRVCKGCGDVFVPQANWRQRSYCSIGCYRTKQRKEKVTVPCAHCKSPVTRNAKAIRRTKAVLCSAACSKAYHVGERSSSWRGGHSHGRGPGWQKRAAAIRERDGHCCRWCGMTREENGAALSVDHVRPWREFDNADEANHDDNLVSLCRKCHGKKVKLENAWLRGDGLALQEYRRMVGITLPPRRPDQPLSLNATRLGPPPVPSDTRAARETERRRKIGAAHRGKKRPADWCNKISVAKTRFYKERSEAKS